MATVTARELRLAIEEGPLRPAQLEVLALCWFINLVDGFDMLAIAYAGPRLATEWALTPAMLGAAYSAGLLGMLLGAIGLAPLADRYGRARIVAIGLALAGLAMWATALARTFPELVILRILTGIGIASLLASLNALVAEYSNARARNLALGLFHSGYVIGALVGGIVAAGVIDTHGWRVLFAYGAMLTGGLMVTVLWRLPESPQFLLARRPGRALPRLNAVLVRLRLPLLEALPPAEPTDHGPGVRALWQPRYRRCSFALWIAFFAGMLTLYFLLSWIPKLGVDAGHEFQFAAYAGTVFNVGGILGMLAIGLAPRGQLARTIGILFLAATGMMVVLGSTLAHAPAMFTLTFLTGFCAMGAFIGLYLIAAHAYPSTLRVTAVGWATGIGRLGAMAGPAGAGALLGAGCPVPLLFAILSLPLLVIVALTPWLRIRAALLD